MKTEDVDGAYHSSRFGHGIAGPDPATQSAIRHLLGRRDGVECPRCRSAPERF